MSPRWSHDWPIHTGYVADQNLARQLAEIGVILLMFGVGLHFSAAELLAVRAVAVPGAIGQMAIVKPARRRSGFPARMVGGRSARLWSRPFGGKHCCCPSNTAGASTARIGARAYYGWMAHHSRPGHGVYLGVAAAIGRIACGRPAVQTRVLGGLVEPQTVLGDRRSHLCQGGCIHGCHAGVWSTADPV
jgi:hypothetical protein